MRKAWAICVMLLVVVGGVLLCRGERASAYSSIRVAAGKAVRWDLALSRPNQANGRIHYKIGTLGTADRASFAGPIDEFVAIQKSFNVWRNVYGSQVDFEFTGAVTNPRQDLNDDVNTVYWTASELSPGVFGITNSAFDTTTGQLLDTDLVLNDRDFAWDTLGPNVMVGTPGRTYVEQIAVHEIGHILGLDHTFLGHASMFAYTESGAINFLTLSQDETGPMLTDYRDTNALLEGVGSVKGRVTSSGGVGRLGIQVALIDVSTRKAVIGALTDREQTDRQAGDFEIVGVPVGTYWVLATRVFPAELGSYYASSFTDLMPVVWGVGVGASGVPTVLRVVGDAEVAGVNIEVGNVANHLEPNDSVAQASPMVAGQMVGSRIEGSGDRDFYAVTLTQGVAVTFHVHSDAVGQDLNPELELIGPDQTTVIATGEFGSPVFRQTARDIEQSFFGTSGVDFDCFIEHTPTQSGTHYVRVRGTSNTTGGYVLSVMAADTYTAVDPAATRFVAGIAGGVVGGSAIALLVEPRTAAGAVLPNSVSRTVELVDRDNGDAVLETKTQPGPWSFSLNPGPVPVTRHLAVRVDGVMMMRELRLPIAGVPTAGQSSVRAVTGSLVADGADETLIEVVLRDATGRVVADASSGVTVTVSAGTLTAGATSGLTVPALFDSPTGSWRSTLRAPATGTSISLSASAAGGVSVSGLDVPLTAKAAGTGGGPAPGGGGGGGGGCAVGAAAHGFPAVLALLSLLLAWCVGGWVRRVRSGSSHTL